MSGIQAMNCLGSFSSDGRCVSLLKILLLAMNVFMIVGYCLKPSK